MIYTNINLELLVPILNLSSSRASFLSQTIIDKHFFSLHLSIVNLQLDIFSIK